MASTRFEEILHNPQPEFELQWADIQYTSQDVQEFLSDHPACGRCIRFGQPCRMLYTDREKLTVCAECDDDCKRCSRKVEFMATMLSRKTCRPIGAILEEWEAELTPPRELYDSVLKLRAELVETEDRSRAAQEATEARAWRMVKYIDVELEEEQQKVAMLTDLNLRLEATNIDLKERVAKLEGWKTITVTGSLESLN